MEEQYLTSTEALPSFNSFILRFTATLKSLLSTKSTTSLFRLLLKRNGSFEVVAGNGLLWVFTVFIQNRFLLAQASGEMQISMDMAI